MKRRAQGIACPGLPGLAAYFVDWDEVLVAGRFAAALDTGVSTGQRLGAENRGAPDDG